jgi:hypothetical protein
MNVKLKKNRPVIHTKLSIQSLSSVLYVAIDISKWSAVTSKHN